MPPKGAKAGGKKKTGYMLAEKFDPGFVIKDNFKNIWTLGTPIGQGGFGLIYSASKGTSNDDTEYVIKIEPKDNGPLFCECHFYGNCAKEEDINAFMKQQRLKHLAVPKYIASGICEYNSKNFRYIVMHRFAKDLQTILNDNQHYLPESFVLYLTRQILNSLQYIHEKGYAHGDIKGANIMLKNDKEAYLVDYGLAHRFSREGTHTPYAEKPERRHNGTIEYTSRDAHSGVIPNRRADLEILAFCIVHWLSGTLPWINSIDNKEEVQKLKNKAMKNIKEFIKDTLDNTENTISNEVKKFVEYFLTYTANLGFDSEPNYNALQAKITETLKQCGYPNEENFQLMTPASKITIRKRGVSTATAAAEVKVTPIKQPQSKRATAAKTESEEDIAQEIPETIKKGKSLIKIRNSPRSPAVKAAIESPVLDPVKKAPAKGQKKIVYNDSDDEPEGVTSNIDELADSKLLSFARPRRKLRDSPQVSAAESPDSNGNGLVIKTRNSPLQFKLGLPNEPKPRSRLADRESEEEEPEETAEAKTSKNKRAEQTKKSAKKKRKLNS